ncbi:MAG: hypothetical protein DI527_00285 [Chelatococcus sp.]|nr:MAG: hypothetical protein DI527_00285 [Chelatococcus sp.]
MSVQALPTINPVVEPPAPRRSSAGETGREGETFTLPAEAPARTEAPARAAAQSRDAARADDDRAASDTANRSAAKADAANSDRANSDRAGAEAGKADEVTKDARATEGEAETEQASEAGHSVPRTSGSPSSGLSAAKPVKFDAGALVSITEAETGTANEAAGEVKGSGALVPSATPAVSGLSHKGPEHAAATSEKTEAADEAGAGAEATSTTAPIVAIEVPAVPPATLSISAPETPAGQVVTAVAATEAAQASAVAIGMTAPAVPPAVQTAEAVASRDAIQESGAGQVRAAGDGARQAPAPADLAIHLHAGLAKEGAEAPSVATGDVAVAPADAAAPVTAEALKAEVGKASPAAEGQPAVQAMPDAGSLAQQASAKLEPLRVLSSMEAAASQHAAGAGAQTTASQPTPLHVVPIEIGLKALSGMRQFDIRLDPAELGRVDVNLSISDDGSVSAKLVVDRVDTLHLLQRDARTLERAFEQAGLKPSDGGVDISLRDQSDQSAFRQRQQEEGGRQSRSVPNEPAADDAVVVMDPAPVRRLVRLGGVDLSI